MKSIRKLVKFLKPYRVWAILAPLAMILEVAMDLTVPYMIQLIIDNGVKNLDFGYIIQTGALMIVLGLVAAVGGIGCTIYAIRTAQYFGADLRATLFRKVQSLSFGNLDKLGTGQLITRLTNDVTQMQEAVAAALRIMVRSPLLFIGGLIMTIITAPQLILVPVILMVFVLISVTLIVRKAYPMFTQVQGKLDKLNSVMQENLAGVRVVKAFVRAAKEIERFSIANEALTAQMLRVARVVIYMMPIMMMLMNLGMVGALWFGGIQVQTGSMTVGQIIAFINYLQMTLMSLVMTSMLIMQLSRAAASADRIVQVLESEPDVQDKPNATSDIAARGRVTFENVTFSYDGHGGDPVLRDISFVAEPGQTVALLGTTGAGKSSLVNLIPRFYDVTGGRVLLDGIDVRDMQQIELRRHIGVALQEAVLFTGTIRDNIRYGKPDASAEEVITAAKAAQAHDFIMSFPQGYDTETGQRGVNLSGGQKQRIAIARALLVRPRVLILDDSTSSVDVETEAEIQTALKEIMRDRTSFVIAQRISTVLNADKILVIDDGRIAAEGTHAELMTNSPIYRDIYDSQLGNGGDNNG
jgi:ATP-binding cassette, subfamily B, multidrug efflux pump